MLIPTFRRADHPDNSTFITIQDREGNIVDFKQMDSAGFQLCLAYHIEPDNSLSVLHSVGDEGVMPLYHEHSNTVYVCRWGQVFSVWEEYFSYMEDSFADYYMRKRFEKGKNIVSLFPSTAANMPLWKKSEYELNDKMRGIWDKIEAPPIVDSPPAHSRQSILNSFNSVYEMLRWLDGVELSFSPPIERYKARVLLEHLWQSRAYDLSTLLQSTANLMIQLDIGDALFKYLFEYSISYLNREEMRDVREYIIDEIEADDPVSGSFRPDFLPKYDIENKNKHYLSSQNRVQVLTKLLKTDLSDDLDIAVIEFSKREFITALKSIQSVSDQSAFSSKQDPYGSGVVAKRLILELSEIEDYPEYWKRLFILVWRAIEASQFIAPEQLFLKNFLWKNTSLDLVHDILEEEDIEWLRPKPPDSFESLASLLSIDPEIEDL